MNGLLNTFEQLTNFSGKSHNKHPQWYNEPLRLTKAQRDNPIMVFEDFFECYHLHEVRQTLWEWLVEVISSQNSISNDGIERNNHIYFYEKIEQLVEACFILQKEPSVETDGNVSSNNKEQTTQKMQLTSEVNDQV